MQSSAPNNQEFYDAPSRTVTMVLETAETVQTSQTLKTTETKCLEQLRSRQQEELMDKINDLRSHGLSHHGISLPQLIVCGDQSSGKSSLLESLTCLRFPAKMKTGTTFPCAVILKDAASVQIGCEITPGPSRSEVQQNKLKGFKFTYFSREEFDLPKVIEAATDEMAFRTRTQEDKASPDFYDDVLNITYSGPGLPSLTVVDLPGLIEHKNGKANSARKVADLVKEYMENPKSVILAVMDARADIQNQKIIKLINDYDLEGSRTIGILTKPDNADVDPRERDAAIALAKSMDTARKYGWHVVKNRGSGEESQSDEERDKTEELFFTKEGWATIPKSKVGIPNLRTKLSCVLFAHIKNELPDLVKAIQEAVIETDSSLKTLGKPRETSGEQRSFLTRHAEKFQTLTNDALRGIYTDPFFALNGHDQQSSSTRLRTEIQNMNIAFAQIMYSKGHTWNIEDQGSVITSSYMAGAASSEMFQNYDCCFVEPEPISRNDFLNGHIGGYVRQSRPPGLPSLVNPWVIGEVFRQQSQNWENIAQVHLRQVFESVQEYSEQALDRLMDPSTASKVICEQVQPELDRRRASVEAKLQELLVPYKEQVPVTYDPNFMREIEEMRSARYRAVASRNGNVETSSRPQQKALTHGQAPTGHLLSETFDDFTNSEILDLMQAYYKHAISVFINNVAVLAIENCLIKDLSSIFSPSLIANLSDESIYAMAAESPETREQRDALNKKLDALQNGKRVMRKHITMRPLVQAPKPTRKATPGPQHVPNIQRPQTPEPEPVNPANESGMDGLMNGFTKLAVTPPPSDSEQKPKARNIPRVGNGRKAAPSFFSPDFNVPRQASVEDDSDED